MSPPPLVSVVIACRNERDYISGSVDALLNGTVRDIQVIVVDGMSTDGTREVIERLASDSRVVAIDNPALITPVAFNIGVRAATGEFICICGAHAIPARDWIERSIAAQGEHPEAIAVGGVLDTQGTTRIGRVIAAVMSSRFGVGNARFRTGGPPGYVDTVVFSCYRRRAFEQRLFDEQLATNQDDEFNTRLIACGERLWFDPRIQCRYFCRPDWAGMLRQYWRYGRYKPAVFRKAGRIGSMRQLAPPVFAAFVAAALVTRRGGAVLALYAAAGTIAAVRARSVLFLPVAASLHLAYGFGFLAGMLDRRPIDP